MGDGVGGLHADHDRNVAPEQCAACIESFLASADGFAGPASTREMFHELLDEGMTILGLPTSALVAEIGASLRTVQRWRRGDAAPVALMRSYIVKLVARRVRVMCRRTG